MKLIDADKFQLKSAAKTRWFDGELHMRCSDIDSVLKECSVNMRSPEEIERAIDWFKKNQLVTKQEWASFEVMGFLQAIVNPNRKQPTLYDKIFDPKPEAGDETNANSTVAKTDHSRDK